MPTPPSNELARQSIPLRTVVFEGNRYVVEADIGVGRPVPLMVHGNARLFLSLTHAVAALLAGGPVERVDGYGYSARGRGRIDVTSVRLGDAAFDIPGPVPVFDQSDDPDAPAQGMLGTRFLLAARASVDFAADALHLGVPVGARPDAVTAERRRVVPLRVTPTDAVTIEAFFPAIGRSIAITPSTVANALTLHRPLFEGRVDMQPSEPDLSPDGTAPGRRTGAGVGFEVGGVLLRATATFEDLAEYANVPAAELATLGMLGFDWMKEHRAVIDYANLALAFEP